MCVTSDVRCSRQRQKKKRKKKNRPKNVWYSNNMLSILSDQIECLTRVVVSISPSFIEKARLSKLNVIRALYIILYDIILWNNPFTFQSLSFRLYYFFFLSLSSLSCSQSHIIANVVLIIRFLIHMDVLNLLMAFHVNSNTLTILAQTHT